MATDLMGFLPAPERRKRIISLSLPIIGGMVSQNVLNLVDTYMVGHLGNEALAAVGLGSFAFFLSMAFMMGMSSGVQAMAARRKGEGRLDETAIPLNGGLLLAAVVALPVTVLGIWLTPRFFPVLSDDPVVAKLGVDYLQIRLVSVLAVGMNFAFRGYWNAVDRPSLYMRTLVVMHAANILFNWLFIFGKFGFPEMGAAGAAMGSAISTYMGLLYYLYQGYTLARDAGFLRGIPNQENLITMGRLALPAGIERTAFSASLVVFFWIIGQIGTPELAAANVLIQFALVGILPGVAFGLAAGTLGGQALGRGDPEDARRWGWEVTRLATLTVAVLSLPALFFPRALLGLFIHDPATVELGALPLQIMAIYMPIDTVSMVLINALLGVGAARTVMAVSVSFQWLLFLPLSWAAGPLFGFGLIGVWIAQGLHRGLQAAVMARIWHRAKWAGSRV